MASLVQLYVMWHPELWKPRTSVGTTGLALDLALLILFLAAGLIALLVPGVDYWAMFALVLVGPLAALLRRWIRWTPRPAAPAGTGPDR